MESPYGQQESTERPAQRNRDRWLLVAVVIVGGLYWWASSAPSDQGGIVRSVWLENHDEAVAKATASGKPILVNFTGSDWCGWCVRLKKEVFDTGIFATWAVDQVVLLECDFPRSRPLTVEQTAQNERLAERYGIRGFPTVLVLTAQGEEIARAGYLRGGAAAWIDEIDAAVRRGTVPESP